MMAYVDAMVRSPRLRRKTMLHWRLIWDDIQLGAAPIEAEEAVKQGLLHSLVKKAMVSSQKTKAKRISSSISITVKSL